MKFIFLKAAVLILSASVWANVANAGLIELKWDTTISNLGGEWAPSSTVGELISIIITVDNGGASTLNQIWGEDDFIGYRIESATGWVFSSSVITLDASSGSFATNGSGIVTSTGNWQASVPLLFVTDTSWNPLTNLGAWYNNGINTIAQYTTIGFSVGGSLSAVNVAQNQIPLNWNARTVQEVPEPSSLVFFALGLIGLSLNRFKKQA
jgi:hypothetical protein